MANKRGNEKQSLCDFYRENKTKTMKYAASMCLIPHKGKLVITYPSGFKWELQETDFPNRDLIPCYIVVDRKYVIDHYERETTVSPLFSQISVYKGCSECAVSY